ncbi:MAG: class I SAM-dependent methyltransferase [Patescibacteria group bacterium]
MKNKDLKKIYNRIYRKGEKKHFTKLKESKNAIPSDEKEAIKGTNWQGKKVLEIGCGTGRFAYEMVKRGADVVAIDYSQEGIKIAKDLYKHKNLVFQCKDLKNTKGKYDIIISLGTLEHLDKPLQKLKLFKKHLKPKGSIIFTCPYWSNPRGYILMSLFFLFDAPITLADLHYFSPADFENFAKNLRMTLKWRTFDESRAYGDNLIKDFEKRLPNVLGDAKLPNNKKNIQNLLKWLKKDMEALAGKDKYGGATALYYFKK